MFIVASSVFHFCGLLWTFQSKHLNSFWCCFWSNKNICTSLTLYYLYWPFFIPLTYLFIYFFHPDDKRWHGLHSGQRQSRRVARCTGEPAAEEWFLYCHVSSGGPEVLIEDRPPSPAELRKGAEGANTRVLNYCGWGRVVRTGKAVGHKPLWLFSQQKDTLLTLSPLLIFYPPRLYLLSMTFTACSTATQPTPTT